ncbi:MAG: phosphonate C-P lyase system protein PhnG [Desulfobaccales bacterium]|jgi:alpha-D-ribose 1-methylphosphonate 5-triphosphate synthase subunit PhnG
MRGVSIDHWQVLITKLDPISLRQLFDLLAPEGVKILKEPESGLIMMAAKDSLDTDFYLGEILVTEAEAEYRGFKGYGMVLGEEPEKALLAAAVEAIWRSDHEDLQSRIRKFLEARGENLATAAAKERKLIARTKVSFETMAKG